jgi:4-hydroxybenzoate polyprenyltransferase/phosphoserine phosphatase
VKPVPLVVDLDGTLIKTDMLVESLVVARRGFLKRLGPLALGLIKGKSHFKSAAAREFHLECETLAFRSEVLELIETRSKAGDKIVLATAATETIAKQIADQLGKFSIVLSSTETLNLSGPNKAAALVELFGSGGFDYVGDSAKDLPVWRNARTKYFAGNNPRAMRAFNKLEDGVRLLEGEKMRTAPKWVRALRLHQWVKNLLIFAPAIAAHQLFVSGVAGSAGLAFLSFSLMASAIYLLNDIVDLQSDRRHPAKRSRPVASGEISIKTALITTFALVAASLGIGLVLPIAFNLSLIGYFFLTSLYSFWLKRLLLVDVVALAGLYTLRVVAGGFAVELQVSSWLLAFSFFIFLSLSFLKRSSELASYSDPDKSLTNGRPYEGRDLPIVNGLGVVSGLLSVLVFALYLDSDTVTSLYVSSQTLWLAVPILTFWISWVWVRAGRGEVDEDPILFALKDRASLISGVVFLGIVVIAQVVLI